MPKIDMSRMGARLTTALLLALGACAETAAPVPTDVFDPLLSMDAVVTELPPWQSGDGAAADATGTTDTTSGLDSSCPGGNDKPDGTCCAAGLYWDAGTQQCAPAGPTGCFATGAEDPADCAPRWCFTYVDQNDKPCSPGPETCRAVASPCPAGGANPQVGCPAGQAPEPQCAAAGTVVLPGSQTQPTVWSDGVTLPSLPTLTLLAAPPAKPAPLGASKWCLDGAGAVIDALANPLFCMSKACELGQRPKPTDPTVCEDVNGPSWSCPSGFVGDSATCTPDPGDCTDAWGGITPGPNVVFASATAASGGTGSQAAPFQKLSDAVAALPTGGTIALGAGVYAGNIELLKPISVRGSCAKDVIIQGAADKPNIFIAEQSGSQISHVTLTGGRYGVRLEGPISAKADHLLVFTAARSGISVVDGADFTFKDAVVRDTQPSSDATLGRGITVDGASLTVSDVRLLNNRSAGLYAADSTVVAKGLVIDGTLVQDSDKKAGFGLYALGKGTLTATDLRVTSSHSYGVRLEDGVSAFGNNWFVDATKSSGDQTGGVGVGVLSATLKLTDARITHSRKHGLWLTDTGADFSGHNIRVAHTEVQTSDNTGGDGVVIEGAGVSAQFSGLAIYDSYTHGLTVAGSGATLGIDFATIDTTWPRPSDMSAGGGLEVVDGAKLVLPATGTIAIAKSATTGLLLSGGEWQGGTIRVQDTAATAANDKGGQGAIIESGAQVSNATLRVSGSHENGIVIVSKDTTVKNAVLEANLTLPRVLDASAGGGVLIAEGAKVMARVSVAGSSDYGLTLEGAGTQLDAQASGDNAGISVAFTQPSGNGHNGEGIQVVSGAVLNASAVRVQNSFGHALYVYGAGSALTASQVTISGVQANSIPGWGRGISVANGATANLNGARIEGCTDVGLFIADTATTANINDLVIDGGTRGAAVQNRAFVTGHRWRLQKHSEISAFISGVNTRLTLRDLAMNAVGRGLQVSSGATARISRMAMVDARDVGVLVTGAASSLDLFDARVSGVSSSDPILGHGLVAQSAAHLRVAGLKGYDWTGAGILSRSSNVEVYGAALSNAAGSGIRASDSDLVLSGSRTLGVTDVGLSQSGGTSNVSECAFVATAKGASGTGSGVEALTANVLNWRASVAANVATAGVLIQGATVTGDRVRVSGNGQGLVREGGSDTWLHSLFFGNLDGDVVDPGVLAPATLPASVIELDSSDSP